MIILENKNINIKIFEHLHDWDPLGYGPGSYETEIVDVLQALHESDDINNLARKIQAIYEFSFEELIPLDLCRQKAEEILHIKHNASCEL